MFLEAEFKTITVNVGLRQAYLGMNFQLDFERGCVQVSMEKYVEDVCAQCELNGSAKTPATAELFESLFGQSGKSAVNEELIPMGIVTNHPSSHSAGNVAFSAGSKLRKNNELNADISDIGGYEMAQNCGIC